MSINLLWSSHYSESFTVPSLLVWTLSPRRVTKESVGNDQEIELDSGAWSNVVREGWLRGDRWHWAEPVFSIRRSTTGRIEIFSASLFWTSLGWLLLKMKRGTSSWVNYHVWRWAVGRLSCPLQQVSCELSWISVGLWKSLEAALKRDETKTPQTRWKMSSSPTCLFCTRGCPKTDVAGK